MSADTETLARKVREEVIKPEQSTLISPDRQSPSLLRREATVEPRFELFHFVFSVCSQKVRGTLMEKGVTFGSNELTILPPQNENYCPQYVRLRLRSEAAAKHRPVSSFTGQSSVDSEGFDPLVVPTLVDHETGRILADSKAICLYLCDALSGGTDLLPADIREAVLKQVQLADTTPHVALLYGADPDGDRRPESMQAVMPGIHAHRIDAVRRNIPLADGDPLLLEAYQHKIVKEEAAASFVINEPQMRTAISKAEQLVTDLDRDLGASTGPWLFGDRFTLADLFWAVSLYRFLWLGYSGFWKDGAGKPRVEAYANRLFARPSVKDAIIQWPGHPPSENVIHLLSNA
uniref:HCH-reductive dechlorinase LinD n=1 Tax=Pseudomonas aeruginosa TaxID=287 RepID=A5A0R6_PSEAI|nr:HCH-reductive dechlorinase LinD [Pseudomonas aeruginosa]